MGWSIAFMIAAAFTALNVVMYVMYGQHWYNLAVAIFCGAMALFNLMKAATSQE